MAPNLKEQWIGSPNHEEAHATLEREASKHREMLRSSISRGGDAPLAPWRVTWTTTGIALSALACVGALAAFKQFGDPEFSDWLKPGPGCAWLGDSGRMLAYESGSDGIQSKLMGFPAWLVEGSVLGAGSAGVLRGCWSAKRGAQLLAAMAGSLVGFYTLTMAPYFMLTGAPHLAAPALGVGGGAVLLSAWRFVTFTRPTPPVRRFYRRYLALLAVLSLGLTARMHGNVIATGVAGELPPGPVAGVTRQDLEDFASVRDHFTIANGLAWSPGRALPDGYDQAMKEKKKQQKRHSARKAKQQATKDAQEAAAGGDVTSGGLARAAAQAWAAVKAAVDADPLVPQWGVGAALLAACLAAATRRESPARTRLLSWAGAYALFGGFAFHALEPGTLDRPLDCLYLSVVTLTTIGYGDLAPATPHGRAFLVLFTLGGLGLFGALLSAAAAATQKRNRANVGGKAAGESLSVVLRGMEVLAAGAGLFLLVQAYSGDAGLPNGPLDALYFATVTATTVGFGDLSPKSDSGKLAVVAFSILSLGTIADAIALIASFWEQAAAA